MISLTAMTIASLPTTMLMAWPRTTMRRKTPCKFVAFALDSNFCGLPDGLSLTFQWLNGWLSMSNYLYQIVSLATCALGPVCQGSRQADRFEQSKQTFLAHQRDAELILLRHCHLENVFASRSLRCCLHPLQICHWPPESLTLNGNYISFVAAASLGSSFMSWHIQSLSLTIITLSWVILLKTYSLAMHKDRAATSGMSGTEAWYRFLSVDGVSSVSMTAKTTFMSCWPSMHECPRQPPFHCLQDTLQRWQQINIIQPCKWCLGCSWWAMIDFADVQCLVGFKRKPENLSSKVSSCNFRKMWFPIMPIVTWHSYFWYKNAMCFLFNWMSKLVIFPNTPSGEWQVQSGTDVVLF